MSDIKIISKYIDHLFYRKLSSVIITDCLHLANKYGVPLYESKLTPDKLRELVFMNFKYDFCMKYRNKSFKDLLNDAYEYEKR